MFKSKLSKVVTFLMAFAVVVSLTCTTFAADEATTKALSSDDQSSLAQNSADDSSSLASEDESSSSAQNQNILKKDLYLSGDDVTMDQLVDGNVFITGKNVTITGQVNGNLFVAAKTVTFQNSYIVNTAFIAAETVDFDAAANDIYCAANHLNVSYNSYVVRDVHLAAKDISFLGYVGRNADMSATTINLGNPDETSASAYITGDFSYEAGKITFHTDGEASTIADNDQDAMTKVVSGTVNASITNDNDVNDNETKSNKISFFDIVAHIVIALIVYFVSIWLFPKKIDEHVSDIMTKPAQTFGFGFLALLLIPIASVILLITLVGAPVGLFALFLYVFAIFFAKPVVNVALARLVKNKFGLSNMGLEVLAVVAISIIFWAISLIPYVGVIFRLILTVAGFGFIVVTIFKLNNGTTKEEKKALKEEKKAKKVAKKEAKPVAKKQAKTPGTKKEEKTDSKKEDKE